MNHIVTEAPVISSEEPPLPEIPLQSTCVDCSLQCACPIGTRLTGERQRLLPILNKAASVGGKKGVRAQLAQHDSGVLDDVLQEKVYGIPNVTSAACVHGRNEAVIRHAVEAELHNRRSNDEHQRRRQKNVEKYAYQVARARIPTPEELLAAKNGSTILREDTRSKVNSAVMYVRQRFDALMGWVGTVYGPTVPEPSDVAPLNAHPESEQTYIALADRPIDSVEAKAWIDRLREVSKE